MSQTVTRLHGTSRETLSPVSATPTLTYSPTLLFNEGYFDYNGSVYDLTSPGLHRLFNPMVNTTHMVIGGDPVALLRAAAWLTSFGKGDEGLTHAQKADKARTSKLNLLCNATTYFTKQAFLDPWQIENRVVRFITMDTPNNVVDAHVALEVKVNGSLVLADVALNDMFKDANGNRLNAAELVAAVAADTYTIDPLARDGYAVEPSVSSGFDATGYAESYLLTDADRRAWRGRIFQAVGIDRPDGHTWWKLPAGSSHRASWVESIGGGYWHVKDDATWSAEFYA